MEIGNFLVSEELHYHRVFMRTNRDSIVSDVESIVQIPQIVSFVSDALDYSLFVRNIEGWISPFDSGKIKRNNVMKNHFNFDIGDAITRTCAIQESFKIAKENGFDEKKLLKLALKESLEYAQTFIGIVLVQTRPVNISFIYALAFAGTLCGIASEQFQLHLMSCITSCVVSVFHMNYAYEWMYYDFKHWAFAYVFRHKQIHCR